VGGKIFYTTKETLNRCKYFATLFDWNEKHLNSFTHSQPIFIDQEPTKFRKIINHLRNIDPDPGPYADFYQINKLQFIYKNLDNNSPIIIKSTKQMADDDLSRNDINEEEEKNTKEMNEKYKVDFRYRQMVEYARSRNMRKKEYHNKYNDLFPTTIRKEKQYLLTREVHNITLRPKQMHYNYISNLQLITNTGIKKISIRIGSQLLLKCDASNPYMITNIQKYLPDLLKCPWTHYEIEVVLTRSGMLQIEYDSIADNKYNKIHHEGEICKMPFYQIENATYSSYIETKQNTSALLIKKNPNYDQLILSHKDGKDHNIFLIIDKSNEHEYVHDDFKDTYYVKISEIISTKVTVGSFPSKIDTIDENINYLYYFEIILNYSTPVYIISYNQMILNKDGIFLRYSSDGRTVSG
jgi:hypothetical protein